MANYPMVYQPGGYGYSGTAQQMYPAYGSSVMQQPVAQQSQPQQGGGPGLIWVDGEVGAKAWQMPQGWPANQPIALWDTNDTCIYLKSTNPMGMPNPLQRAHYTLEERRGGEFARSGAAEPVATPHDDGQYVRKEDMERMKMELMEAIGGIATGGNGGGSASAAAAKKTGVKGET